MLRQLPRLLLFVWILTQLPTAHAEPTITSPPPADGASPAGPFVFTFSEAMNPAATTVDFFDIDTFQSCPTSPSWSLGNTVLTCTPTPAFSINHQIVWSATGESALGDPLGGTPGGLFTTGSGSGGGGSGTNAITTFSIGKIHHYLQTSSGSPTLDPTTPYGFSALTALASNRTATSVTLTNPTGATFNLFHLPPPSAELFILPTNFTSLVTFDTVFPTGNYGFFVQAAASNQSVLVNLPSTAILPQPAAPHLTNYPAAQVVNPNQPFVLGWDPFPGGAATNYIFVEIGESGVYRSPDPGKPGALSGTAQTFTIPAGTLQQNSNYFSRIGFYNHAGTTNATQATDIYRATFTEFNLVTTGTNRLVMTNLARASGVFSFDVLCNNGQTVTIEYTNILTAGPWPKLLTTNSPGTKIHIVSTQAVTQPRLFYRARNGQ